MCSPMSLISKWKGPLLPSMREMDIPTTPASRGTKDCLSWIRPREPRKNLLQGIFTYLMIEMSFYKIKVKKELTASRVPPACTMDNANGHSTKCQNLFSPVINRENEFKYVQLSTFRLIMYFLPSPLMFMVRWVYSTQWSISFSC